MSFQKRKACCGSGNGNGNGNKSQASSETATRAGRRPSGTVDDQQAGSRQAPAIRRAA